MKRKYLLLLGLALVAAFSFSTAESVIAAVTGWVNGISAVTVTDADVGIGTENPDALLDVKKTVSAANLSSEIDKNTTNFDELNGAIDIDVQGDYAYIAANSSGASNNTITIADISDPSSISYEGEAVSVWNGDYAKMDTITSIAVSGNYAYVTARSSGDSLTIIDVSNPASPSEAAELYDGDGTYNYLSNANHVAVDGDYAYVVSPNDDGLTIIDVSTPSSPSKTKEITHSSNLDGAAKIAVSGNYAYIGRYDAISVYDISTKTNPVYKTQLAGASFSRLEGIQDMYIDGDYLFVASYIDDAVTVIDISNPLSPTNAAEMYDGDGTFNRLEGANGIYIDGNYAYIVAQYDDAFTVADISDPTSPSLVDEVYDGDGTFNKLDQAFKVGFGNGTAFVVAHTDDSLTAIGDVSDSHLLNVHDSGSVGIGTVSPQATLDVAGFMKLTVNSAAPATCGVSTDGSIAVSSSYTTCICKSGTGWVKASDGSTSCTW